MTFHQPLLPNRLSVGPTLQASKWQKIQLLIDEDEMQTLLTFLDPFWIVPISGIIPKGCEIISHDDFLKVYQQYVNALKQGKLPHDEQMRAYFSSVFTKVLDALYAVPINEQGCLIKILQPVVQLQAHRFAYSLADETFRSMVFGIESIYWGIQFAYPSLYQDENLEIHSTRNSSQFPNTPLFKKLQEWVRSNTIATPFNVNGKRINVPIRLGKKCLNWINNHPQLREKGLEIVS